MLSLGKCKKSQWDVGTVEVISLSKEVVGMWTERPSKGEHQKTSRSKRDRILSTLLPLSLMFSIQSIQQSETYIQNRAESSSASYACIKTLTQHGTWLPTDRWPPQ